MIINKTVATFFFERKQKNNKLFQEFKKLSVTIHDIITINENRSYKDKKFFMARGNDLVLLKMVRKNEKNLVNYLHTFKKLDGHERRYYNFIKWAKKIKGYSKPKKVKVVEPLPKVKEPIQIEEVLSDIFLFPFKLITQ